MACPMSMRSLPKLETPPIFNHTSIFALSAVTALLAAAYGSSFALLRTPSPTKIRILFIWHLFDGLMHLTLEASYLYNVFFTSMTTLDIAYTRGMYSQPMVPAGVSFLGDSQHLYGSFYGTSATARLWQEYAKADKRRGGSDLTIISLGLLTVFVMGPLALYVCRLLRGREREHRQAWFWMAVVATGELYGGFISFAPEWLAGSPHLDTEHFLTLWVYLVFFNGLWVVFPAWVLWGAYQALARPGQPSTLEALNGSAKDSLEVNSVQ